MLVILITFHGMEVSTSAVEVSNRSSFTRSSVTSDEMARKPVKKQKENPVGCDGEGKQSKGNIGEEKRMVDSTKFEFSDEITRISCEEE